MKAKYPILEYDLNPRAILDPHALYKLDKLPERVVLCFFQDVLQKLRKEKKLKRIGALKSVIGPNPFYSLELNDRQLLVMHPGMGASLCSAFLEELIAFGARKIIACGVCGTLDNNIPIEHTIILTSAVRDEGTSYHYLPPGREVQPSKRAITALQRTLERENVPFVMAKTWTTDAFYRETEGRRQLRVQEGCQVVEMEAAAFFAVAQFRQIDFGQIVYVSDLVVPEGWDLRAWHKRGDIREQLFWLAAEACSYL